MKNQMMAILALALMPVACGTLAPTSPDEATSGSNAAGSVISSGRRVSPLPTCTAQTIVLSTLQRNSLRITATLADSKGNRTISWNGCAAISWSVSPKGAYVQPVAGNGLIGSPVVVDIVVTDANQTYTVTASSGGLTASMDVKSQLQQTLGSSAGSVTSSGKRVSPLPTCTAQAIVLSTLQRNSLRLTASFTDSKGSRTVSSYGCAAISWSVSPKGAYVQPVAGNGTTDSPVVVDIAVTDSNQTYTVTASSGVLTASMDVKSQPQQTR